MKLFGLPMPLPFTITSFVLLGFVLLIWSITTHAKKKVMKPIEIHTENMQRAILPTKMERLFDFLLGIFLLGVICLVWFIGAMIFQIFG